MTIPSALLWMLMILPVFHDDGGRLSPLINTKSLIGRYFNGTDLMVKKLDPLKEVTLKVHQSKMTRSEGIKFVGIRR